MRGNEFRDGAKLIVDRDKFPIPMRGNEKKMQPAEVAELDSGFQSP